MDMKEFAIGVQESVAGILGDEAVVTLRSVRKNNGVILQGLVIEGREKNVSPTIYLDGFYDLLQAGTPMEELAERLVQIYENDSPGASIDMGFYSDFDKVKDRVVYRLVNAGRNEELLKTIPHIRFLDFAICFYYAFQSREIGNGAITICNAHMKMWNTDTEELLRLAQDNTPRLFEAQIRTMAQAMAELTGPEEAVCDCQENIPLKILSNSSKIYGAACILYPGLLKEIAYRLKTGMYILPCSIHEVILLTDTDGAEPSVLREMVSEVNASQVLPEEFLSNNVYYFDNSKNEINIIF